MTAGSTQLILNPGEKVLFFGIGNVGRQDDGLGVRLVERLESEDLGADFAFEANYQLNIEDALLMSEHDVVIFADATREETATAPFSVRPVAPRSAGVEFSTHAMRPEGVLALCEGLYGRVPRAYMLALPGYSWEIDDHLSERAMRNLEGAVEAVRSEAKCMRSR